MYIDLRVDGQNFEVRLEPALRTEWYRMGVAKGGVSGPDVR